MFVVAKETPLSFLPSTISLWKVPLVQLVEPSAEYSYVPILNLNLSDQISFGIAIIVLLEPDSEYISNDDRTEELTYSAPDELIYLKAVWLTFCHSCKFPLCEVNPLIFKGTCPAALLTIEIPPDELV